MNGLGRFFSNKLYTMSTTKYITIADYMDKYGVSRQTVYNKINANELKVKKILDRQLIEVPI